MVTHKLVPENLVPILREIWVTSESAGSLQAEWGLQVTELSGDERSLATRLHSDTGGFPF